jgi:hypothetical protein
MIPGFIGRPRVLLTTMLCALFTGVDLAGAARVRVFVINAANQAPLDSVTVCIGTTTNAASVGRRTTTNGEAIFDGVAPGVYAVRAWRSGFSAGQASVSVGSTATFVQQSLTLSAGSAPDPCAGGVTAPPATTPPASGVERIDATATRILPPSIVSAVVNGGVDSILASNTVRMNVIVANTAPTEYRMSETSEQFPEATASWRRLPFAGSVGVVLPLPYPASIFATPAPTKRVFVQVRAGTATSQIVSDTINVQQQYEVNGSEAVSRARSAGFTFSNIVGPCRLSAPGEAFRIDIEPPAQPFGPLTEKCSVTVFGGAALSAGWQFTALRWQQRSGVGTCSISPLATPGPRVLAPLTVGGASCSFYLTTVLMTGPAGLTWTRAFGQ